MNTLNIGEKLFVPWTKETAPEASLPVLEQVERIFGFVPNLIGTLAGAPAAAKGYHALIFEFTKGSQVLRTKVAIAPSRTQRRQKGWCTCLLT